MAKKTNVTVESCVETDTLDAAPHVGQWVLYTLGEGNNVGETRPAQVVKVLANGNVSLMVTVAPGDLYMGGGTTHAYYDGGNIFNRENAPGIGYHAGGEPGTWRYADSTAACD